MDEASRKAGFRRLPRVGGILVNAVGAATTSINLGTGGPGAQAGNEGAMIPTGSQSQPVGQAGSGTAGGGLQWVTGGFIGKWIDIWADGGDIGIITGPTNASVTGGNAPVLATTGGLGTAGNCVRIAAGTMQPYYVTPDDQFLGLVGAAAGSVCRISISSM